MNNQMLDGYQWGVEYPINGKKPDLPDDVTISWRNSIGESGACMAGKLEWKIGDNINEVVKFRIVDQRYKPVNVQPVSEQQVYNSWHERGELPPVGWKGLVNNGGDTNYFECEVVAYHYNGKPILKTRGCSHNMLIEKPDCWKFRPIKSEREKFVEVAYTTVSNTEKGYVNHEALKALYDAGFRAPNKGDGNE